MKTTGMSPGSPIGALLIDPMLLTSDPGSPSKMKTNWHFRTLTSHVYVHATYFIFFCIKCSVYSANFQARSNLLFKEKEAIISAHQQIII